MTVEAVVFVECMNTVFAEDVCSPSRGGGGEGRIYVKVTHVNNSATRLYSFTHLVLLRLVSTTGSR